MVNNEGKNRAWTAKQKEEIIKPIISYEKALSRVARENNLSKGY